MIIISVWAQTYLDAIVVFLSRYLEGYYIFQTILSYIFLDLRGGLNQCHGFTSNRIAMEKLSAPLVFDV